MRAGWNAHCTTLSLFVLTACSGFDDGLLTSRDAGADAGPHVDGGGMDAAAPDADGSAPTSGDGTPERCNGRDEDGDGAVDEGEADAECDAANSSGVCVAGACFIAECSEGFRDCDSVADNGCEESLASVDHCGRCGNGCGGLANVDETACDAASASCEIAACAGDFIDCDGDPATGCEASFSDVLNCGGCASLGDNEPCTELPGVLTSACSDGQCAIAECLPGFADCNATASDGCEQNVADEGCCAGEPDSDGDGTLDCQDGCPDDAGKISAGECGCGVPDVDGNDDGVADCRTDCWGFPSNFDPIDDALSFATRADLTCSPTIDTGLAAEMMISGWCNGQAPVPVVRDQLDGGPEVVIVPLASLTLAAGQTLRLIGERPVILAVQGDVRVDGTIDAGSNHRDTPGAGASGGCGDGDGADGTDADNDGGAGGGGGGFGTAGRLGGLSADGLGGAGGVVASDLDLVPLRAGCMGGAGGDDGGTGGVGGYGGGALQISSTGSITVSSTGAIVASGGGGSGGSRAREGGGGGGSGGALLLEAGQVVVQVGGWITVNGGSGAAGHYNAGLCPAADGADGALRTNTSTAGGDGCLGSGDGGSGAAALGFATVGGAAGGNDAGGGGGGGLGVFVQRPLAGSACASM